MPTPSAEMLTKLRPLLTSLRKDLVERAKAPGVAAVMRAAHEKTRQEQRTADPFDVWVDDRCAQVAGAWVLSCIFVRTLEDRGLLERRRIAGDGAEDSEEQFLALAPFLTARDYLLTVFRELSRFPGVKQVFDARHNPVWVLGPSAPMAAELLRFFRQKDAQGALALTFSSEDTRLLGDLYQDLYEDVRAKYALLQTPDFVEEFILDETLEPALKTFGLDVVKLIDPTCGSGHFLLGAYQRLFKKWCEAKPSERVEINALRSLEQVAGADINPYAVAIARFRLTLAFLNAAGILKLAAAPEVRTNLCVADSLLFGLEIMDLSMKATPEARADWKNPLFLLEDADEADRILGTRYHAVVGNPPYIVVSDKALRATYKDKYVACHREYQLVAPFTERFFQLGVKGGFVGAIVGNGFMKREFGSKLIENVLKNLELTKVVDTSGAYIPGHGTPTAILFGRNQMPSGAPVSAVLGIRGEPSTPDEPGAGKVWRSISDNHSNIGFENEYVTVASMPRERFNAHPWSLGGGGASEVKSTLEARAKQRLADLSELTGFGAVTREDDVFCFPRGFGARHGVSPACLAEFGIGEDVRDWSHQSSVEVIFPYDTNGTVDPSKLGRWVNIAWRYREQLWNRQGKGFKTKRDAGGEYFEYSMFYPERHFTPLKLAFAFVATHNHFVLDRGGKVFKQSAPIIKLPEGATEEDHLALLGYLNSSTACFWMKQVFYPKASGVGDMYPSNGTRPA